MTEKAMTFPAFRPGTKRLLATSVKYVDGAWVARKTYLLTGPRKALQA